MYKDIDIALYSWMGYCMCALRSHLIGIQYNIFLSQSQTDRCESDIKYDSITNRQLPRRTVLWEVLRLVTTGSILENTICTIYTFAPLVIYCQ